MEPKGPRGWEDRPTFTIVGRESFAGIPIARKGSAGGTTTLSTSAYSVDVAQQGTNGSTMNVSSVVRSADGRVLYNSTAWLAAQNASAGPSAGRRQRVAAALALVELAALRQPLRFLRHRALPSAAALLRLLGHRLRRRRECRGWFYGIMRCFLAGFAAVRRRRRFKTGLRGSW